MRAKRLLAALAASAALIVAACGGGTSSGKTLIIGDYQDVDSLGPYYGTVMAQDVIQATEIGLTYLDVNTIQQPFLATSLPVIGDAWQMPGPDGEAAEVTWEIRPWKWSDGTDLTCADFQYWHEWILLPDNIALREHAEAIESIECPAPTTIVVNYKTLYYGMKYGPGFLPKHYYSKFTVGDGSATDMVNGAGFRASELPSVPTSGAYKFESRTPGIEVSVIKNSYYKDPFTGESAKIDRLKYIVCGSEATCIAKYRAGEIDFVKDDLGDAQKELASPTAEFLRPAMDPDLCTTGVAAANDPAKLLPNREARGGGCPTSDLSFRQAISAAIDRDTLLERVENGVGKVAYASYPEQASYVTDQSGRVKPFDPVLAKQILADGGWVDSNGNGTVDKVLNGKRTEAIIEICTSMKISRGNAAAIIADALDDIGIKAIYNPGSTIFLGLADIEDAQEATQQCNLDTGHFDLALHAYTFYSADFGGYSLLHSSQTPDVGGENAQRINIPELDAVALASLSEVDPTRQVEGGKLAVDLITDYVVFIPLHYWLEILIVSPNITGWERNLFGGTFWNVAKWDLAPASN
jgi:peptide/nickel transport system substrate-binding protein